MPKNVDPKKKNTVGVDKKTAKRGLAVKPLTEKQKKVSTVVLIQKFVKNVTPLINLDARGIKLLHTFLGEMHKVVGGELQKLAEIAK